MILTNLILGGIIAASLYGIAKIFWDDILSFMQKVIRKVQQIISSVVQGAKILIQKVREGIKEISRTYTKVDGHWEETTTTKIVSENDVPPDILAKAAYSEETDITDKLELVLENAG